MAAANHPVRLAPKKAIGLSKAAQKRQGASQAVKIAEEHDID